MKRYCLLLISTFWFLCGPAYAVEKPSEFQAPAYKKARLSIIQALKSAYKKKSSTELALELQKILLEEAFSKTAILDLCERITFVRATDCIDTSVVNKGIKPLKVNALHVAVLTGDKEAISFLLSKGGDLKATGIKNLTPAHFTAFHEDDDILNFLEKHGDSFEIENEYSVNALDMWKLTHLSDPADLKINMWNEDTQKVEVIDGFEFSQKTGAYFVEGLKVNPRNLSKILFLKKKFFENETDFFNFSDVKVAFKEHNSPYDKFYLKKISYTERDGSISDLGYGLFVLEDIKKGEVISDYQGEIFLDNEERVGPEYATQRIDASRLRGYLAFSSDGFPNGGFIGSEKVKGVPIAELLVATNDIKAGDQILWDYSTHDIKWDVHKELNKEGLESYFRENSFVEVIRTMIKKYSLFNFDLELFSSNVAVNYVLGTLPALLKHCLKGDISLSDLKIIKKYMNVGNFAHYSDPLIKFLETFENSPIKAEFYQLLLEKAEEGNVQVLAISLGLAPSYISTLESGTYKFHDIFEAFWIFSWNRFCKQDLGKITWGQCSLLEEKKREKAWDSMEL